MQAADPAASAWDARLRSQGIQPLWVWEAQKQLCACNSCSQLALCLVSAVEPAALCLGGRSSRPGLESLRGGASLGLNHVALGSEVLVLWVEQLASAPDALPPEVSGVGPQFANLHAPNRASGERWG